MVLCFLVIHHRGSISMVWAGRVAAQFAGRRLLALPNEAGQGGGMNGAPGAQEVLLISNPTAEKPFSELFDPRYKPFSYCRSTCE